MISIGLSRFHEDTQAERGAEPEEPRGSTRFTGGDTLRILKDP